MAPYNDSTVLSDRQKRLDISATVYIGKSTRLLGIFFFDENSFFSAEWLTLEATSILRSRESNSNQPVEDAIQ